MRYSMSYNHVQIFGRRSAMVLSQGMFALGSALSGAAQNMNWLIAARSTCFPPT